MAKRPAPRVLSGVKGPQGVEISFHKSGQRDAARYVSAAAVYEEALEHGRLIGRRAGEVVECLPHVLRQVQTQVQQLLADQGLQAGAFDITCAFAGAGNGGGGSHLPQPFSVPSGAWAARPKVPDSSPPEAPQGPPPGWSRIVDIIA